MNYTDFGATCAEELEQDGWTLTRPTFETPKGGVLTVVGYNGKTQNDKKYYVVCNICASDPEVFGQGVFSSLKANLLKCQTPCGCSNKHFKTKSQYQTLFLRKLAQGHTLKSLPEKIGSKSRITLVCEKHGEFLNTAGNILYFGSRCGCCGKISSAKNRKRSEEDMRKFLHPQMDLLKTTNEGILLRCKKHGTEILRKGRGRKNLAGRCPLCRDERVSEVRSMGPATFKKRCIRACRENGVILVGCTYGDSGVISSEVVISCPFHGESTLKGGSVVNFIAKNTGGGCPYCSGQTQTQSYIHAVHDEDIIVALKLGIAKDWKARLYYQNHANLCRSVNIGVWEYQSVNDCKNSEKECKKTLKTGVLSAREMKDGWTETVSVLDLDKVIAIYEKYGGVRIK